VIDRGIIRPICSCKVCLVCLCGNWTKALLVLGGHLRRRGPHLDTAASAIKAHAASRIHNRCAIHIGVVNNRAVHVHHGSVIAEGSSNPTSAIETGAAIAEAVVHTPVKANNGAPISGVPQINAVTPSPVARSP
jgi:hypothetical protein